MPTGELGLRRRPGTHAVERDVHLQGRIYGAQPAKRQRPHGVAGHRTRSGRTEGVLNEEAGGRALACARKGMRNDPLLYSAAIPSSCQTTLQPHSCTDCVSKLGEQTQVVASSSADPVSANDLTHACPNMQLFPAPRTPPRGARCRGGGACHRSVARPPRRCCTPTPPARPQYAHPIEQARQPATHQPSLRTPNNWRALFGKMNTNTPQTLGSRQTPHRVHCPARGCCPGARSQPRSRRQGPHRTRPRRHRC